MTLIIPPYRPFELGESIEATNAIENYNIYNSNKPKSDKLKSDKPNAYLHLKECFANLYLLGKKVAAKNIIAAETSDALGRTSLDQYDDICKKIFIANAANSALTLAKLRSNFWNWQCESLTNKLSQQDVSISQLDEAGLGMISEETANKNGIIMISNSTI